MPRLSVIVPVYKVEKYIHKCVDSILNQTFTDFELILVDDGSPDNCGKICDEYAEKDSRVRVIHKENGGLSDARNFGIDVAKGEIIGFVDSDDIIDTNMYGDMIGYMDEHDLDVVCADTYVVRGERKKFNPRYDTDKIFMRDEAINEILNGTLDNSAVNKIYKRSIMGDVRYPKGRVYEDVATTYKYIFQARRVGYICKPYYYYFKRGGSIVSSSFNSKSRYDCFKGYKERLAFAVDNDLGCVEDCKVLAVETALATLTAFYANKESEDSARYKDIVSFLRENGAKVKNKLKRKQRFLFWSLGHHGFLYKIYAKLSAASKKVR